MLPVLIITALPDLALTKVRELTLEGNAYLAAASGLVRIDDAFFVVADDDLRLAIFRGASLGATRRLLPGTLPTDHKARKAAKPDLEALTILSRSGRTHTLLAIPSGSTQGRTYGASFTVDGKGVAGEPRRIDFQPLFDALGRRLPELNIEGAAVVGNTLRLLQRGNGKPAANGWIKLDLARLAPDLEKGRVTDAALLEIRRVDLGELDGVPLSFTDASPLPDGRMVFVAAAEATDNPYDDGEVKGSVVGVIGATGNIVDQRRLRPVLKAEGVHATLEKNGDISLLIVNDADNPNAPAMLYRGKLTEAR